MEHLALEIFDMATEDDPKPTGSKYAVLDPDQSITVTETSEIFASGDVWSHSFTLNVHANAHVFGTSGDIHGSRMHERIDRRRARLWADGLPLLLGYLRLGDEASVSADGDVDVTFESGQKTFEEMIEGGKANQVPLMGDVRIGVALWRKRHVRFGLKMSASIVFETNPIGIGSSSGEITTAGGDSVIAFESDGVESPVQEYPRMVFPKGTFTSKTAGADGNVDCLNTDSPYDAEHPFCNVALCYQRYGYEKKDDSGNVITDYNTEPEAQRGYEYMPADRVNSAPNFFVIYWIRALMRKLGIHIEENQMEDVEDLRRLFLVNTKCEHRIPKSISVSEREGIGRYTFSGHRLVPEAFRAADTHHQYTRFEKLVDTDESKFAAKIKSISCPDAGRYPAVKRLDIKVNSVEPWSFAEKERYEEENSILYDAFATSDCFPDVDISEVIKAVENGFGVRFLFSHDYQRVRIVLLRNVFNSKDVQDIKCDIIEEEKVENNTRGFRMTYGNSEDTHFYYKGFADMLPHKKAMWIDDSDDHDYSHWDLDADYADVIHKVSAFNKTCYVTPVNGNAYGVKVDKDAKRYADLHPSLFEFAGFMDAEDGDCTGDEETVKEISMGFTPAIMNDLNMEAERNNTAVQRFALFVDERMRPRRPDLDDLTPPASYNDADAYYDVDSLYQKHGPDAGDGNMTRDDGTVAPGEFAVKSDMSATVSGLKARIPTFWDWARQSNWNVEFDIDGSVSEGYRLYLQDNYEPNDDGVPPVETHDWGLMLGIMRGSGSDAGVDYAADPDDGEDNETWEIRPGSSVTSHPDTCDSYGNEWDYKNSRTFSPQDAEVLYGELFPAANASFSNVRSYGVSIFEIRNDTGDMYSALVMTPIQPGNPVQERHLREYVCTLSGHSDEEIMRMDREGGMGFQNTIVELSSSYERCVTCREVIRLSWGYTNTVTIDGGVSSRIGRFSLKLRAEKPNPYFNPSQPETSTNHRYLHIDNENLQGRGLCDTFYKEYSYWVRNARIVKRTVHMGLAQLLAIEKTKRVRVGDVMGLVRKVQYSISNKTGLGDVTMEIMYI